MSSYSQWKVFYGDLHNHCGISYGHGSLEEALQNAREQLDFCSVTGHGHWPDIPPANPRIAHIIEFHKAGFSRLRKGWREVQQKTEAADREGRFLTFLSYEIHSNKYGDHTVLYKDFCGEIIYTEGIPDLKKQLAKLKAQGHDTIAFPHHIGYLRGFRGINWDAFTDDFSPIIELVSMHGCSEASDSAKPFVHAMGPSDWESTIQYGLSLGKVFGVIGSTDHHSAHPGSYGHGKAAVWAKELTREAIWDALYSRRTYALTGDNIEVVFSLNDAPMGSVIPFEKSRSISGSILGGGIIDYVDVVKNNRLLHRFSQDNLDLVQEEEAGPIHTKIFLEVGWGKRGKEVTWDVSFGISEGKILAVEPRFRGHEVLSPLDESAIDLQYHFSHWERTGEKEVCFKTTTYGNPNSQTRSTQGMCLEVKMPKGGKILASINQIKIKVPLERILDGAKAGYLYNEPSSPAWRINHAPLPWQYRWTFELKDDAKHSGRSSYYLRVRQENDQWAWSSPIFVGMT